MQSEMSSTSSSIRNPPFGRIYFLRQSVNRTLSSIQDTFASDLSSCPSSSNTGKKPGQPKERPCLCCNSSSDHVKMLLSTTFDRKNPMEDEADRKLILPNVTKENLLKHLISIHPTTSVPDRRSIHIDGVSRSQSLTKTPTDSFSYINSNCCLLKYKMGPAHIRCIWTR